MIMGVWLAVHTHALSEEKARFHLLRQGFEVYLPRYSKRRSHARKVEWVPSPLFPRYLFVAVDEAAPRWHSIQSTVGVASLVKNGGLPAHLPAVIISAIRARENETGLVELDNVLPFKPGEVVRVASGPLQDQTGIFQCLDDKQRVVLLLDLLGRAVTIRLPVESVAALA
jgi:transcriptional antiterminator RfaH